MARSWWWLTALGAGLMGLFFSCAPRQEKPEVVTITAFVGFSTGSDNRQIELHRQLATEFNASHQDIQLQFLTVNQAESVEKFRQLRSVGHMPDLVLPLGMSTVSAWHDEWLDLTALLKKHNADLGDFFEPPLKSLNWPASLQALPLGVYPSVLYYNVDMFDRIKLPHPPHTFGAEGWTYDELLSKAIKLTRDRSGKTPLDKGFDAERVIQYGYDGSDWSPLLVLPPKFGGAALGVSDDGRSALIDSPGWKAALSFLRDSIHTWFVRPVSGGNNASPVYGDNDPIGSNTTAMWESFSWVQYAWGSWNNNFKWNVAAIPAGPTGRTVAQANMELAVIPVACRHPDQAMEVLLWLVRQENLKRLSQSWGCVPIRKSLAAAWVEEQMKINPVVDWQVFIDSIEAMGIPNHESWVPAFKQINELYDKTLNAITTGQLVDTDQAATDLNQQVQALLDAWWKKKDGTK